MGLHHTCQVWLPSDFGNHTPHLLSQTVAGLLTMLLCRRLHSHHEPNPPGKCKGADSVTIPTQ
jgi:hypothetical protein